MKSSEYWKGRFDQIEQSANNQSVEYIQSLDKKYQKAAKEIDGKINAWYQRLADNNGVSITEARRLLTNSELKEFKWTVQDYIKAGKENALDQRWMKELENASAKFHINRLEALKLECRQQIEVATGGLVDDVDKLLSNTYKNTFYHSCYEVQKGVGVGFDVAKLSNKQVQTVINKPWSVDGTNFSTKLWTNKTKLINNLDQELSRMVMTGESPQKAIENIKKSMNTSVYNAKRLVMTESAYFTTIGQKDAFGELDVEEYEIVATLDNKTSDICQKQDGQHYPVKDMMAGVNAPPFHVFCRSTTCPYFDDEFSAEDMRVAKDEDTGEWYEVPANMKYPEWKKSIVDGDKEDLTPVVDKPKIEIITDAKEFSGYDPSQLQEWELSYYEKNNKVTLTDDELVALDNYGEGSYEAINAVERFDENSNEYQKVLKSYGAKEMEKAKEATEHLSSAISKFDLNEDIVVHRAVRDVSYITGSDNSVEALQDMIGKTYTDKGYVSTSLKYQSKFEGGKSDAVHLEITVPKGSNGALIDDYVAKDEYEFLINRNQQFVVVDAGERVVQVQKYDFKTRQYITVDKTERYMKVQLLPDENKVVEEIIEKTIDDCVDVKEVEDFFKQQDWFIHGEGKLEGWRSDEQLSLQGCDVECAKGIYKSYEQLFDKFPQMKNKLAAPAAAELERFTYAQCTRGFGSGFVQVNTHHFKSAEKLLKTYAQDLESGFHPVGTSGFAIVTHELGHALDDYLTNILNYAGFSGWKPKDVSAMLRPKVMKACGLKVSDAYTEVSGYATKNSHEWFAECFAEYMCSANPRKVAKEFGKWIEEIMKEVK